MRDTYIAVVGPSAATPAEHALGEEIGRRIAEAGAVLVCGGMGGLMEAAASGCARAGGRSVGIVPGERASANPYLTVAVATGMGEGRNAIVVRTADVVIAVAGEFGTLSEIALALKMGKPVVGLRTWEVTRPGRDADPIVRVDDPGHAVATALDLARSVAGR